MSDKPKKDWERISRGIYRRMRSPHLWIAYSRNGKRFRESVEDDRLTVARKLLALREGEIAQGKVPALNLQRIRFKELAEDFLNDYRSNQRKSLSRAELAVRTLSGFFEGMRAADITTDQINKYVLWRQGQPTPKGQMPSNGTINRELSALKRMFSLAAQNTPPKVRNIPHIVHLNENNVRTGFFERDEFLALKGALLPYLRPLVTAAYWTGMRKGELLSLQWGQLDLRERRIILEPGTTKNNQGRVIFMPEELWRVLREEKDAREWEHPDCPWVFHREGKHIGSFRTAWKNACETVGLEGRLFHDLRRTGVRNLVRAGVSERVAMEISGHRTRSVFDRYNIVSEDDLKEAAKKQEKHLACHTSVTLEDISSLSLKKETRESPGFPSKNMVDRRGIEPRTYGLRVRCSTRLS